MQVVIDVATFFLGAVAGGITVLGAEIFFLSHIVRRWLSHGAREILKGESSA